eukprot:snap_masked-scaffold_12-processed-gene-4.22-mRNA-1 protein AED:1.00 eAED:1.00 QI:0/0/0/0/1/1/2/0/80
MLNIKVRYAYLRENASVFNRTDTYTNQRIRALSLSLSLSLISQRRSMTILNNHESSNASLTTITNVPFSGLFYVDDLKKI